MGPQLLANGQSTKRVYERMDPTFEKGIVEV